MSDENPSNTLTALIKSIADVAGSMAALLAYIVALFGLGDTPIREQLPCSQFSSHPSCSLTGGGG